jgi:sugar O-acyltransferase (sialic acid O-acetyltransferase NeuD family)
MKQLVLIGSGGHAKSVIDIIEAENKWNIYGLIGKKNEIGQDILGYSVIGSDENLEDIRRECDHAIIGVGQIGLPCIRVELAKKLKKLCFKSPFLISPNAYVSKRAKIGVGSVIGHGVVINADAEVGKYCIVNSQCLIEHGVRVGDFCHISTGAKLNGDVLVGENSFIGSNSIIRNGVSLPCATIISAGKRIMGWPLI